MNSIWPAFLCRFPFPYSGPPGTPGIPACINSEIFAANFRCRIDQRIFFFLTGISSQTIHKIVKYDRKLFIIRIFPPHCTPPHHHLRHRVLKAFRRHCNRRVHALKAFPREKFPIPVIFYFCGTGKLQIKLIPAVPDFPVPGAIVDNGKIPALFGQSV